MSVYVVCERICIHLKVSVYFVLAYWCLCYIYLKIKSLTVCLFVYLCLCWVAVGEQGGADDPDVVAPVLLKHMVMGA